MSKTIDEKVVSMQFDNKNFESNVQQSLSTLDKLKQALNFKGASKGLEEINAASNKVNMSGMGSAIDSIHMKFSALEVMGVTALANITNSAVNAGKRMLSALTIEPIKSGFQEYETQINAIQTILANTQKEGTNIKQVNAALDELNTYADKTIYNFTEMTRNIGTFTAAGVDLKTSVSAIQGIANLAAVSGSTSQQASTAMYQLSQALASGTVKLMDWNSVVNAGMGGQVFQDALRETSQLLGTGAEAAIKAEGSFRESLRTGWLTSEVLTETLKKFTTSGANEYVAKYTGLSKEVVEETLKAAEAQYGEADAIEYASKALAEKSGKSQEEIKQALQFAKTAEDAATKVKTFSQLWDTMKEAVQSGWGQTFRLIIGDFEEARELLTGLSNFFNDFIGRSANKRNKLLEGALSNNPFTKLAERIEKVTGATKEVTAAVENFGSVVDKVIGGEFGNGQERIDNLAKAGYDWAHIQNLVNEKLGDSTRHATNYKEAQEELNKTQQTTIEDLIKMSDKQLKSLGFTKDEIEAFRQLEEQSKKTGIPIKDLIKDMDQLNGRTLLINSLKNVGQSIVKIFESIGKAWNDAFPPMTSTQLYNIIAGIHKLSTYLVMTDETADKLTRTFKGVFAIFDLISSILGGGVKLVFSVVKELVSYLDLMDIDILSITANIGDAIVAFRDWYEKNSLVNKAIESLVPLIVRGAEAIVKFVKAIYDLPEVQKYIENIKDSFDEFTKVGQNIIEGLANGLVDGIDDLPGLLIELGNKLLEVFKAVLGIHSPSVEFEKIGGNIIEGLFNGIQNGFSGMLKLLKNLASKMIEVFSGVDFTKLFVMGSIIGFGVILNKIANAFDGIGDVFEGVGEVLHSTSKWIDAKKLQAKSEALLNIAKAIAILAGSVFLLAQLNQGDAWSAVGVLAALTVAMLALVKATDELKFDEIGKLSILMAGMSAALLILSFAVKKMSGIESDSMLVAIGGLAACVVAIIGILLALSHLKKVASEEDINNAARLILKMSISLAIMAAAIKIMSGISEDDVKYGGAIIAGIGLLFMAFIEVSKFSGEYADKAGSMLLKMSIAMALMAGVIKLLAAIPFDDVVYGLRIISAIEVLFMAMVGISWLSGKHASKAGTMMMKMAIAIGLMGYAIKLLATIDPMDTVRGLATIAGIEALFAGFALLAKFVGTDTSKIGSMFVRMSVSLILMAGAIKLLAMISVPEIVKGLLVIAAIEVLFGAMIALSNLAGRNAAGAGRMLLKMSLSILILAGAIALLSILDPEDVKRGTACISALMLCFAAVIAASGMAAESIKTIIALITSIGLLVGAVVLLSMMDQSKVESAVKSLSMLMGMFSILIAVSRLSKKANGLMGTVLTLTFVVGALASIIYILSGINPESAMATAKSLLLLLLSLSASMIVMSKIKMVSASAYISLAAMTLVVGLLGGLLYLLKDLPVESTLATAKSISTLLLSLSAACVILAGVGLLGASAYIGIGALLTLIAGLGTLIIAIGALVDKFPALETFLDKGIPILNKIGYALGSFVSNIAAGLTDGLPKLGKNLSDFMTALEPFIKGANNIKPEAMQGCKTLAEMLIILMGANILDKLTSWITGGSSLASFAQQLVPFGKAMAKFSNTLVNGKFDESTVTAVANAGKLLAEVASALPKTGGIMQSLSGTNMDLKTFGSQLKSFGEAMALYSSAVSGKIDEASVTASANAGKALGEMAGALPKVGGVMESLTGASMSMTDFGTQLKGFGEAMVGYSSIVGAEGAINEAAITASSNAGLTLAKLADALPKVGGIMESLTGKKMTMTEFGTQLKEFATAMVGYSQAISAEGAFNGDAVTASANAGLALAKLANALPKDGGLFSMFSGSKVTLEEFGADLKMFGEAIAGYASKVVNINAESTNASISVVKSLVKMVKSMNDLDTSGVSKFKNAMSILGTVDVKTFADNFKNSSKTLSSIGSTITKNIANGIKPDVITKKIASVMASIKKAADSKTTDFTDIGKKIISKMDGGIKSKKEDAKKSIGTVLTVVKDHMRSYHDKFYSAGSYLVSGFADGIKNNAYKASNAGRSLAKKAYNAARKELDINSPSKVFRALGYTVVEGFVMGIDRMAHQAENSSASMANNAINSTKQAIAKMAGIINGDIETQPTIRPVVDLSDVRSSVNTINDMFGINPSVRTLATVGGINQSMDQLNQNGFADDVVSAIDKLRKDLGNIGGTTNVINGITYDDGSNINDAVATLVRAAKIGRRS